MTPDGILTVTTPSGVPRVSRPPGMTAEALTVLRVTSERQRASDEDPPPF
jgi:hypothetical protein